MSGKGIEDTILEKDESIREQFKFNIIEITKNKWFVWFVILLIPILGSVIFLPILGKFYFRQNFSLSSNTIIIIVSLSLFLAIFCILDGFFAGWWWKKIGKWATYFGFLRPLESMIQDNKKGILTGYINNLIFGKGENFLLYNAIDQDQSSMSKMFKHNAKSLQLLAAMFIVVLNFFINWSGLQYLITDISSQGAEYLNNYLELFSVDFQTPLETFILFYITLSVALTILAIILPILLITDHAFVYQYTDDKQIKQAGSKPRDAINDTFSIFTIISGFSLIRNDIQIVENPNFLVDIVIFIVLLALILIYGIPIIFAAFDAYYEEHTDIVNELRDTLRRAGYPILISQATPISEEIMNEIEVFNRLEIPDVSSLQKRNKIIELAQLVKISGSIRELPNSDENSQAKIKSQVRNEMVSMGYNNNKIVSVNKTDTQILMSMKNRSIYIILPGTRGTKDIFTDLNVGDSKFTCGNMFRKWFTSDEIEVHKGANRAICSSMSIIKNYIKQNEHNRVIVSGHSLGGMLATLLVGYLVKDEDISTEIELYTFGNPAVGNREFADFINLNVSSSLLIANEDDPVPNLLPEFLDYHQITNKVILDTQGQFAYNTSDVIFPSETKKAVQRILQTKSIPEQHFMDEYLRRLQHEANNY